MQLNNASSWAKPWEVVFLTNFSDACFRAIPAVAQIADDLPVRLTLLHAYDSKRQSAAEAEATLHSFFPEADRYRDTSRRVMPGSPLDVLRRVHDNQAVDLIVCPASDMLGLPRPVHRSLRGRILRGLGLPLWTIGRGADPARLGKKVRNVGCWLNFDDGNMPHVAFAVEYATRLNARLHLFYVPPEIHDGMILPLAPDRALHPSGVRDFFQQRFGHMDIRPEIHMTPRHGGKVQASLTQANEIDVLFTGVPRWPMLAGFRRIDSCPCPAICIDRNPAIRSWNRQRDPMFQPADVETRVAQAS
ncbi:MAG: universal stress protein [Acidobacteriota bacterium]